MATVTHYIYSHYDAQQRETGQVTHEGDPWQTGSSVGVQQRLAAPPRFVPATAPYDDWGGGHALTSSEAGNSEPGIELAHWYRSMTNNSASGQGTNTRSANISSSKASRPSSLPPEPTYRQPEKRTKNNWFIMRAIQSEPSSAPSTPPPTLADILTRDPPPLPGEEKFIPPVWLAIGPSNKGFAMLQQSGWTEGEGLGAGNQRYRKISEPPLLRDKKYRRSKEKAKANPQGSEAEKWDNEMSGDDDMTDVQNVIDLELDDADDTLDTSSPPPPSLSTDPYTPKALLTPIPTVLKSDRLGIGLKAKTVGPYKASQKRVTHNAAALAAHIKAAGELRKKKSELGRGRKGFERARKRDEDKRKQMLAYLNE